MRITNDKSCERHGTYIMKVSCPKAARKLSKGNNVLNNKHCCCLLFHVLSRPPLDHCSSG